MWTVRACFCLVWTATLSGIERQVFTLLAIIINLLHIYPWNVGVTSVIVTQGDLPVRSRPIARALAGAVCCRTVYRTRKRMPRCVESCLFVIFYVFYMVMEDSKLPSVCDIIYRMEYQVR